MTLSRLEKAPWPAFGGKSGAAKIGWAALGDVAHYAEPFCFSLGFFLLRPHPANRAYYSETVNDIDGLIVNAWRAIQLHPQETAEAASWPVTEADLMARHLAILKWSEERELERLMADPDYCDPRIAGWWIWGQSAWIGGGWCAGTGPWIVGADGRITKRSNGEPGVSRRRPELPGNGRGVNAQTAREPGVSRQRPHLHNGQGVNTAAAREPGVSRQLPHISDNGQGVNTQTAREPGVAGLPLMPLADYRELVERDYAETGGYHPMTMPEVRRWFDFLRARLRHVRILNGDWSRLCTNGALKTLSVRGGKGVAGVFLDPPYEPHVRVDGLYAKDSTKADADAGKKTASTLVREWCLKNGNDPELRIVLAGMTGEGHEILTAHGWREVEWYKAGFLSGGMANIGDRETEGGEHPQTQERLWLSPHCLKEPEQLGLL